MSEEPKPPEPDDATFAELLRRAKAGDASAFAEIDARHGKAILLRIRDRLPNVLRRHYDSLDLRQSVVAEVLRDLHRFEDRGEDAFRNWLYLKAENKIRSKLRRHLGKDGARAAASLDDVDDEPPSPAPSPATQAGDADDAAALRDVFAGLDDEDREVLALRTELGLPFAEIASRVGLPTADAARKRYARALLLLRGRMERED